MKGKSKKSTYSTTFGVDPCRMRGESMKDKSKKSTYSTTFGVDPTNLKNQPIPQPLVLTRLPLLRVETTKAPALFAKKNAAKTASISGAP